MKQNEYNAIILQLAKITRSNSDQGIERELGAVIDALFDLLGILSDEWNIKNKENQEKNDPADTTPAGGK